MKLKGEEIKKKREKRKMHVTSENLPIMKIAVLSLGKLLCTPGVP